MQIEQGSQQSVRPHARRARLPGRKTEGWELLLLLTPALVYLVIFQYGPMWGAQIAFRDFQVSRGFWTSPWAGLKHFRQFFASYYFGVTLRNTLTLTAYRLVVGTLFPLVLAIMLHYILRNGARRTLQTLFYAPNFVSVTVVASMVFIMLSPRTGVINFALSRVGLDPVPFMADPAWFPHIFVGTVVWQFTGVNAIIYLGVLSGVNPETHESAMIDGAGKLQRILRIDLPAVLPTATVLFILAFGQMLSIDFDRAFLLQSPLNISASEVISTYIYKVGVIGTGILPRYSFAAAIGLFQSTVNLVLVVMVNTAARRLSEHSLY